MKRPHPAPAALATTLIVAGLTACSGGGGGGSGSNGDVTGLTMPNKLSVVVAKSSGVGKVKGLDLPYGAIARAVATSVVDGFAADSDYHRDLTRTHVWDPSIEPLNTVNMILCLMDQTEAAEMVNQGAYIALVDEAKCEEGKNKSGASQGGAQTSSNAQVVQYNKWVIESTRADLASAQHVRIWIPGSAGGTDPRDSENILVEVTVHEAVSDTRPFGRFVLNFRGETPQGTTLMRGTLKTVENDSGKPEFSYYSEGGQLLDASLPFGQEEQTHVVLDDAGGNSGYANIVSHYWGNDGGGSYEERSAFAIAFNDGYFLRAMGTGPGTYTAESCADRNDFNTRVWQYNLYHAQAGTVNGAAVAAGQRVDVNSGIPVTFTRNNQEVYGHVGYWGSWTEDGLGLTDGMTVTRDTWGNGPGESYTVKVSEGKLHRRSREYASFAEVKGADFFWYGDPANTGSWSDYVVRVNGAGDGFEAVGAVTWDNTTGQRTTVAITPIPLALANTWDQLWLWSDALGGSVVYKYGATNLIFYREEVVSPDDAVFAGGASLNLACYDRCIKAGITSTASQESDVFQSATQNWDGMTTPTPFSYTVTPVAGGFWLMSGATEVKLPSGFDQASFAGGMYQWGLQSGEMVTASVAGTLTNWWDIYDAAVSYRWETGTNDWNRQSALVKATGELITFDKPLQLPYSYAAGDDPNLPTNQTAHPAGNKFLLEYGGQGQLWGFPWIDDPDTGRSWAGLTLRNGVLLKDVNNREYVVKAMEREQTMNLASDQAACTGSGLSLGGATNLTLPSSTSGSVSFSWNTQLALDVAPAPAVIGGELQ